MMHCRLQALLALSVLSIAACGGGESAAPAAAPPGGAMPPMPVEAVTLAPKPVDRTNEYVATVRSRRSTTIQPQVDGLIRTINVQPGQRVGQGAALMRIDADRQQAAVATLESTRAARQADLQFLRQQAERAKRLVAGGAISQEEYERAQTALETAEAQMRAIDAQIREQRVALAYHTVTAPTSGIVGDIPVRVGDRVTPQTVLTTIDERAGLELYINVPVAQAQGLKPGLQVHVLDADGREVGTSQVDFVAPSVDASTQSVLVKAPLRAAELFRPDQIVRVRVVYASEPALTVPLVAVTRINGQYFVFVAEKGEGGQTVARQRSVELGQIVGNDYLVRSGLNAGDVLIVSGIQKIGDGAPVQVTPAGQAPAGQAQ